MPNQHEPGRYVVGFDEIDRTQVALVGGKGAHLGELARIDGVVVPVGFCITTDAFRDAMAGAPFGDRLDQLAHLDPADRLTIQKLSAEVRAIVDAVAIPDDLTAGVSRALNRLEADPTDVDDSRTSSSSSSSRRRHLDHERPDTASDRHRIAYAVRSSATAEDLPSASFAGQQDTELNVVGETEIRHSIRRCWASLFTDRAVTYRLRHGIDHRQVHMAVVVQRMVFPDTSGIAFTADPVTGNRTVVSIDASFGLGEALVSGLINADVFKVRAGEIVAKTIATKHLAVVADPAGGTRQQPIDPAHQQQPSLNDTQAVLLAQLGRRIEAHFGVPQDIEWCLTGDTFHVVQSRPITTLFPIPVVDDADPHVYVSVGHQQMMTDPMKPLGLSLFQLTAMPKMHEAGGRLFVDVADRLATPSSRTALLDLMGKGDPLIRDALETIVERDDFLPRQPEPGTCSDETTGESPTPTPTPTPAIGPPVAPEPIPTDPAIVAELIERTQASIAALSCDIADKSGEALVDFILADIAELKRILFDPLSFQAIMAGMEATWWLNDELSALLGETNAADTLTLSVPNNVTSEMGLALLDVADAIRPHPDVVAFLEGLDVEGDGSGNDNNRHPADFLDELVGLDGGPEAAAAIAAYLDHYGMRCVGEIDITRPRWRERPDTLVPLILANVRNFEPGERARRFEQGRQRAASKEHEVLARIRALPSDDGDGDGDGAVGGERKAAEVKAMIDRVRTFIGYREYPKYGIVSRYDVYKQALLAEADRLVHAGVLGDADDVMFLTFAELHDVVRTHEVDTDLIRQRKAAFQTYQGLTPPRVLTSEGEVVNGAYRRGDVPGDALVGLAVSAGTVEGRARVIVDLADADLEPGDILVTAFTDPSWSPLFVAVEGLVTEVGGQMTHGAVVAREYGLPAVVGVEDATRLIRDGQRIRVDGTHGYVELLPDR